MTVSNTWSENGGPAYVVALHISYIDSNNSAMYIKHNLSTSDPSVPANPSGKFFEALQELINFCNSNQDVDKNTLGYKGYLSIYHSKSYPGLGIPKKLSMMHHIKTINDYI